MNVPSLRGSSQPVGEHRNGAILAAAGRVAALARQPLADKREGLAPAAGIMGTTSAYGGALYGSGAASGHASSCAGALELE
jgi:hypothetical protein